MRVWEVPSQEDPSKTYRVTFDGERFTCTCPDFTFRARKQGRECKHIYAVRVAEGLLTVTKSSKAEVQEAVELAGKDEAKESTYFVNHPMVRPNTVEDREYQRKMVEEALEGNTLVVLPTALGKTVIAELVAAELLYRHPGCRILVMAPTKPLVLQHRESFLRHLKLEPNEVGVVTGEVNSRELVWDNPDVRVVFATPQSVWNDCRKGYVGLEEFALMILDECHRSRSRYAYTRLASEYVRRCPWPRILALTASPGSEEERVLEVVRNLMIERIVWRTEEDEDVQRYIPGVKVSWVRLQIPEQYQLIRSEIRRAIESRLRELYSAGLLRIPMESVNRKVLVQLMSRLRAEIESGVKGANMHYMSLLSSILSLYHALELIESQHVHSLREYLKEVMDSELRSHRMLAKSPDFQRIVKMAEYCNVDHTKVEALCAIVDAHLREKPNDRIMVFSNIRHTAEVLVDRLNQRGHSARIFVGKAEGKDGPRMTQEEQIRTLREFREGRFRVLVATSIGEEGLDVPECGLVVFYEPAVSGIRYVQRRGRTGRRLPGKVVILVAEGTVDEYYFREGYRRARRMAEVLEKVSERLREFSVSRRGPEPRPGEPWPWTKRDRVVIEIGGEKREPAETSSAMEMPAVEEEEATREREEEEEEETGLSLRDVFHCSKHMYLYLLKAGAKGATMAELMEALEGYDPDVVRAAAGRLVKRGIAVRSGERYYAKAAMRAVRRARGGLYTIEVEKVYPGFAVVIVNDSFRARLDSSMYYGPREYLKKGRVLKVLATVKRMEGKTSIIVHDVVGVEG
ncbi:MAG: helicase-related protein [Nitrososphaerota archaeon]